MKRIFLVLGVLLSLGSQAQDSLNAKLLYNWKVDSFPASAAHSNTYNEVWGFVQDGKEYAVIGSTMGTHIFSVDTPSQAKEVVYIPGGTQGVSVVHRDFHDYNGYLYMVCDEGINSSLQIADLSFLPDSAPLVYDSDTLFTIAHNIFIDSSAAKLYACSGENQLNVYSLVNPTEPTLLVNCSTDVSYWQSTIGPVHDVYVRNDTAYCNALERGLQVVDFSDTQNPVVIGSLTEYPYKGYNHSGWLNKSGTLYAFADENHGYKIKLLDVSDITDMKLINTISSEVDSLSIPHNLIIKDNFLYVSYYHDGFYIFNLNNLNQPYISGFYDTSEEEHVRNYRGCWGVYPLLPSGIILASDMQNGLFIFDVADALTGFEEQKENDPVVVYPNPFSTELLISIPDASKYDYYILRDIVGRVVKQGAIKTTITYVSLSNSQSNGVYLLELNGKTNKFTKQIIKAN